MLESCIQVPRQGPQKTPHMFVGERSRALEMEQKPCTPVSLLAVFTHTPVWLLIISVLSQTLYGVTIQIPKNRMERFMVQSTSSQTVRVIASGDHRDHSGTEYMCLDSHTDEIIGGQNNDNGAVLYFVNVVPSNVLRM